MAFCVLQLPFHHFPNPSSPSTQTPGSMSGGNHSFRICSQGIAPLPSLLKPSTTRFRFFVGKLQLPPIATKAVPIFLSLSHRSCLEAFSSQVESSPPPPAPDEEKLLTVSYLVTLCGLSPDAACCVTKSRRVNRKKARSVIQLLRSFGFSDVQIDKIVSEHPYLLAANPEMLKPKLVFLRSEGFSVEEVADIFASNSALFGGNLERRILAKHRFLGNIKLLKKRRRCLNINFEPKLKMLRDYGVAEPSILYIVKRSPETLEWRLEHVEEAVKNLLEMGFDPTTISFGKGLHVWSAFSKETWLRKLKTFQEMSWSESEIIHMFTKYPTALALADEMIRYKLLFFKKNMGWDQRYISTNPALLRCSMEARIIPRMSILKVLMSKGLIEKQWKLFQFFKSSKWFFETYVKSYTAEVPDILKMYEDMNVKRNNARLNR